MSESFQFWIRLLESGLAACGLARARVKAVYPDSDSEVDADLPMGDDEEFYSESSR